MTDDMAQIGRAVGSGLAVGATPCLLCARVGASRGIGAEERRIGGPRP
jgi:hypothetical protein